MIQREKMNMIQREKEAESASEDPNDPKDTELESAGGDDDGVPLSALGSVASLSAMSKLPAKELLDQVREGLNQRLKEWRPSLQKEKEDMESQDLFTTGASDKAKEANETVGKEKDAASDEDMQQMILGQETTWIPLGKN